MRHKNVDEIYALSPMQRLMLVHSVTATGSLALSNQFRYRLTGALDVDRFREAWTGLLARHPVLRTCFLWDGLKQPVQVVRSNVSLPFNYRDLRGLASVAREEALLQIYESDRHLCFDLRKAPLIRLTLLRLGADNYQLIWNRHHLILDRWCVDLLFDDLFKLYSAAESSTQEFLLPAGNFQNYVNWIERQDSQAAQSYWSGLLHDFDQPTHLFPVGHARTRWSDGGLSRANKILPDRLNQSVIRLARENQVTVAAVLQGAIALFLSGRTGAMDVVFGLTVSGRPPDLPDVDRTMGSFINNIPVRIRIDSAARLGEWLRIIHAAQAGRFAFEYVSPVDIHGWSNFSADTPLFDFLTLLHSPETESRHGPGFDIEQMSGPLDSAYPLTLALTEVLGELHITAAYDPACLSEESAEGILVEIRQILRNMVADPDARLGGLLAQPGSVDQIKTEAIPRHRYGLPETTEKSNSTDEAAILSAIWSETLGIDHVGLDEDFFALGGTSIQAALAFAEMERRLARTLPLATLFKAGSIREILDVLERPQQPYSSLVEIQPRGSRPQLLVVPGIGGNVVGLAELARVLGPEQPFYGLQSEGLDGQKQPLTRIQEIAKHFVDEMASLRREPFVLFGICFGATVALEMAHQLLVLGRPPALLIMLDLTFPYAPKTVARRHMQSTVMIKFLTGRVRLYWGQYRSFDKIQRREWLRSKRDLIADMIRHRSLFRENRLELNQRRVTEANLQALLRYRPVPYDGPVRVLMTADRELDHESDQRKRCAKYVCPDAAINFVPSGRTGETLSTDNIGALARELSGQIDIAAESIRDFQEDVC